MTPSTPGALARWRGDVMRLHVDDQFFSREGGVGGFGVGLRLGRDVVVAAAPSVVDGAEGGGRPAAALGEPALAERRAALGLGADRGPRHGGKVALRPRDGAELVVAAALEYEGQGWDGHGAHSSVGGEWAQFPPEWERFKREGRTPSGLSPFGGDEREGCPP